MKRQCFDNYRARFSDTTVTDMDHAVRINGVVDIHRTTAYVFDLTTKEHKHFKTYEEAIGYVEIVVKNTPARTAYKKLPTGNQSYKEFKNNNRYKPTTDGAELYHWNNNLHETSEDHLYLITDGRGVKIGRSKNPQKRLKELKTANPSKMEIVCVIRNKGFLEKTLHRCFDDIRLEGEWFETSARIAKFMALTKDWHTM